MAMPSTRTIEYEKRAKAMDWPALKTLWEQIKHDDTPGWDAGKALEYLIVRAFEQSGLQVEYPYDVPPGGNPIEQIDGLVYFNDLVFLIECKDRDAADVAVIAKVRHQLDRRPPTTLANIFVAGAFTAPALILADLTTPHRTLLWNMDDIRIIRRTTRSWRCNHDTATIHHSRRRTRCSRVEEAASSQLCTRQILCRTRPIVSCNCGTQPACPRRGTRDAGRRCRYP